MKRILFIFMAAIVVLSSPYSLYADEDTEPGVELPVEIAKEYIAKKYNCDIDDLIVGDTLIGRSGAHIEITHGYNTERVLLRRRDFESNWEVESSEPAHQY